MPKSGDRQQRPPVETSRAGTMPVLDTDHDTAFIQTAMNQGLAAFDDNEPGMARLHFKHAIGRIYGAQKCEHLLPELIGMNGRALQRQKRWEEALEQYRKAAAEAARLHLLPEQLRWMGKEAKTRFDMNEPEAALPLLEKSVAVGRRVFVKDRRAAKELATQLGWLANSIIGQDEQRAGELWREAFETLKSTDNPTSRFFAAVNYATFLKDRHKPRQAETYLEEALEIGRGAGLTTRLLVSASIQLAAIYRTLNECEHGGDYLLAMRSRLDDSEAQHELLTSAANCYFAGRNWAKMKAACRDLRELRRKGPTPAGLHDAEMRYAIACHELGEPDESLKALEAAHQHAIEWGRREAILKTLGQKAIVLNQKKDYPGAVGVLKPLWGTELTDSLTARTYVDALIGIGDLTRARSVRDSYKRHGGSPGDIALLTAHIADASHKNAHQAWERVLREARLNDGRQESSYDSLPFNLIAEAIDRLIELCGLGSPKRLEFIRRRARMAEELRWRVPDVFSDSAWRSVTKRASDIPVYLNHYLLEAERAQQHVDALYELERFRSQSLVDVLSERSNLWAGEKTALEFKGLFTNDYQRARYHLEGLIAIGVSWQTRREAAERADELDSQAFTAEGVMLMGPSDRGLHFPENLKDYLEHAKLGVGEAILFQRTISDRALLWLVKADGKIVHSSLPDFNTDDASRIYFDLWKGRGIEMSDRSLSRGVREFALPEQPVQSVERVLSELDAKLAFPLARLLKEHDVEMAFLVLGTDVTNLPLDRCQSWQNFSGHVSFLPTARALGFTRAPRYPRSETLYLPSKRDRRLYAQDLLKREEGRMLLVVDPTNSLRYASLEAAVVALHSSSLDLEILQGARADGQTVSRSASHVGLLHLISHGTFDDASPYRSGMFMKPGKAADALWMIAEVFSDVATPAGRLVVLSGCETGRTRTNLVSEEISLPAAFLASGFAAVVASRWSVDDLSTSLLIGEFYRRWLGGSIGVSAALSQASDWLRELDRAQLLTHLEELMGRLKHLRNALNMRARKLAQEAVEEIAAAGDRPFADPKYWAAFYVVGDGALSARSLPSQKLTRQTSEGKL